MEPANTDLQKGSSEAFVGLLKDFMAGKALQSLGTADESTFRAAVEMVLGRTQVGELQLVMDGSKPCASASGRYESADIFFAPGGIIGASVLLELRYLPLAGVLSGRRGEWISKPLHREMVNLEKEISDMPEHALDGLQFAYYSEEEQRPVFTTVGRMRQDALEKVQGYARIVGMGAAKSDGDPGARDMRIQIQPRLGCDTFSVYSFTLVAIGGRKLLWQSGEEVETDFSFKCVFI